MDSHWLVVNFYDGTTLVHDDGTDDSGDADTILTAMFGAFVAENWLHPTDLATMRAELVHDGDVLAVIDGRDW